MKILWFKAVQEIADNSKEFQASVSQPWNPIAKFAVYQKEEGWSEELARKHYSLSKCKGQFGLTKKGNGFIAYANAMEDNSSSISNDLESHLKTAVQVVPF